MSYSWNLFLNVSICFSFFWKDSSLVYRTYLLFYFQSVLIFLYVALAWQKMVVAFWQNVSTKIRYIACTGGGKAVGIFACPLRFFCCQFCCVIPLVLSPWPSISKPLTHLCTLMLPPPPMQYHYPPHQEHHPINACGLLLLLIASSLLQCCPPGAVSPTCSAVLLRCCCLAVSAVLRAARVFFSLLPVSW